MPAQSGVAAYNDREGSHPIENWTGNSVDNYHDISKYEYS